MDIFTTERLIARRLTPEDVPAMVAIYGDLDTVRYVGDSEPLTTGQCNEWLEVTDRNFEKRGYGMVALCLQETGDLIACAGIVHPGGQEEAELKYAIRKDHWGRGYATEAGRGLIGHARTHWGVNKIIATVFPENADSQKVLSKLGFQRAMDRTNDDGSTTHVWELPVTAEK